MKVYELENKTVLSCRLRQCKSAMDTLGCAERGSHVWQGIQNGLQEALQQERWDAYIPMSHDHHQVEINQAIRRQANAVDGRDRQTLRI